MPSSARSSPPSASPQRGVTLIELMITVAILAIVGMMAAPALSTSISTRAVSSGAEDLGSALRLARSEALKRSIPVAVCPVSDPNVSSPTCLGTDVWGAGWVVFVDRDADGGIDGDDIVIKAYTPGRGVASVTGSSNNAIVFLANGLLAGNDVSFSMLPRIDESSDSYTAAKRTVCMAKSGRARLMKGDDACPTAPTT
ncbi:GspH/FimT family pseudopilin [Ideonella sp.]|uniref:GspH/FimT family pseudopilin n=1 Tax=Ideonella sp. TaxID=1929293 RepID=UPI003BB5490E